jgi:predicted secreted protein
MNMAAVVGYEGSVKIGTFTVVLLNSWELSPSSDILDITSFGDDWKVKLAGLKDWTAKASGQFDFSDTNGQLAVWTAMLNGSTVSLVLSPDGTQTFTGTAYVKAVSPKAGVADVVSVDIDLEGTDQLSYNAS